MGENMKWWELYGTIFGAVLAALSVHEGIKAFILYLTHRP